MAALFCPAHACLTETWLSSRQVSVCRSGARCQADQMSIMSMSVLQAVHAFLPMSLSGTDWGNPQETVESMCTAIAESYAP